MAHFKFLAADLRTNEILAELPVAGATFGTKFKRSGALSGNVQLGDPKQDKLGLLGATQPDRTAIYIDVHGALVWGGVVWDRDYESNDNKLKVQAEEFPSYLERRFLRSIQGMEYASSDSTPYLPTVDVVETNVSGTPDTVNLWANVNDPVGTPWESDRNYNTSIGSSVYTARAGVPAAALNGKAINSVAVVIVADTSLSTSPTLAPRITLGATPYLKASQIIWPGKHITGVWALNPATGLAWTPAEVQAFATSNSFGYESDSPQAAQDTLVFQMYLLVSWSTIPSSNIRFSSVDQFHIARDFIRHVQSFPGGDIGILLDDIPISGRVRDRTYHTYEFKQVFEALLQLSEVIDGFDFAIDVRYNNNVPEKYLNLSYPRRGRTADENRYVFDYVDRGKGLVRGYQYPEDGTRMTTHTYAIGAGEGDAMLIASAVNQDLIDQGYPILEDAYSYKDITKLSTLVGHAEADAAALQEPFINPKIRTTIMGPPPLGSYMTGDEFYLNFKDARFPEGIKIPYRLLAWTANQEDDSVTMEFGTMTSLADERQNA